jgi:hypothetical protein
VTFIRLNRTVARTSTSCGRCAYPIEPYQSQYAPTVGGVALALYCSERCASRSTRARLEVSYE